MKEDNNDINVANTIIFDLQDRIDKAIKYIEEKYDYILGDDTFLDHDERVGSRRIKYILDILKGSEQE